MKLQQQYKEIVKIKQQINERLENLNFKKIKELILWLAQNESFQRLESRDTQLDLLNTLCKIWIEEKRLLDAVGVATDIFEGIDSLEAVEQKIWTMVYTALRMEMGVPEEHYGQLIDGLVDSGVSGIAWYAIINTYTEKREQNILKMAKALKQRGQIVTVMMLLQVAVEIYPENKDMMLELANCWLEGNQWKQAYDCLKKIKKPDEDVREIVKELEKVLSNENA